MEYTDGGILDIDDLLSDLVEDREKLVAVFDEDQRSGTQSPRDSISNGYSSDGTSPEAMQYFPHLEYEDPSRGEIEVNEAVLKANTPLLVRSSSDSVLAPPHETTPPPPSPPDDQSNKPPPEPEISSVLKGALDRLHTESPPPKTMNQVNFSTLTRTVEFPGDRAPLGIHVVPYCSSLSGRPLGLHIKGIEENSRSRRDNLFKEDECIVQINDTPLHDKTFAQSQEVFRQAMSSPSVRVEVLPVGSKPRYEKSLIGQLFTSDGRESPVKTRSPKLLRTLTDAQPDTRVNQKAELKQPEPRTKTPEPAIQKPQRLQHQSGSLERGSPTPQAQTSSSPTPRTRSQSPLASKSPVVPGLPNLTNKKGGKKMKIDLKKGPEGLGFTVVTRDSTVHGPGPILVKNILQRGAAVKDGRLQPGDRILEVNGVDMTGRTQEELVGMLRSTKQGETVSVLVSRQEEMFLPRELKRDEATSQVIEDGREQLMYEIPLNETGSAGLGVSLKGNKSRETGEDLGIFIKSIIHGGAAYKDGRLSINDQLIAVNGESLLGRSNHTAMETLRRSMSSEGNMRGTIQLVVLRASRQGGSSNPASRTAANTNSNHQPNIKSGSSNQEPRSHNTNQRPSGPTRTANPESAVNGAGHSPAKNANSRSAPAVANGNYGQYSNDDEEQDFPPPPSPGSVEQMSRDVPVAPSHHSESPSLPAASYPSSQLIRERDNVPRNRTSKSMDLVADESNVGSLVGQRNESHFGGALGPTLGLMKSSSLESLQTAVSEAQQSRRKAEVPFHRPPPHVVRGRACNQSFRIAIDKSYDGPSEDDDDMSDYSSGHETPASTSSRQDLDVDEGKKKKKTKAKKKEKKNKAKKRTEDSVDDPEKKPNKKRFNLLRFGKKKDDTSKDPAKGSKNRLEALSEEELDRIPDSRDGNEPRYGDTRSGYATPDRASLPDMEDDDSDPNYARINDFRQQPSPLSMSRTPSPALPRGGQIQPHASFEDIDGLYAKVNKSRPPPTSPNQQQAPPDSDLRIQGLRREYQQARAAPGYEELEAARRRVLEHDPNRMAPRGTESRPRHRYEELDQDYNPPPRRDPYDYPTHSKPVPREPASYPTQYQDPPVSSNSGRLPLPQSSSQSQPALSNQRHYPSAQQHRAALRQDVPPSPTAGRRGRQYYEPTAGRGDGYRQASPGRYASPDRYPAARQRYASPDGYRYTEERRPEPRRKDPMIGAV